MNVQKINTPPLHIFSVERHDNYLKVIWADGTINKFHYIWLRDNCHAHSRFDHRTEERIPPKTLDLLTSFDVEFRLYADKAETPTKAPPIILDEEGSLKLIRYANWTVQPLKSIPFEMELDDLESFVRVTTRKMGAVA